MAKKQKRNVRIKPVQAAEVDETLVKAEAIPLNTGSRYTTAFNPDYAPIRKDLTRIAILAVTFFVILIVLSFFLR